MSTEEITKFWRILVQDEQLHQLAVQLAEEEVQLTALRRSLKMMPPLAQVTKETEIKELQQHVNKAHIRHQQRTTHLDEL